jgi:hypothetical protein
MIKDVAASRRRGLTEASHAYRPEAVDQDARPFFLVIQAKLPFNEFVRKLPQAGADQGAGAG